jgi:phage/plasmid-associated DNA primase
LVEFPVRFWLPDSPGVHTPGFEADTTLQDKLLAELPGVLRWMVEGCVAWLTHGLGVPPAVVASTRKYNEEMDTLGDFLRECEDVRQGGRVEKTALYLKYVPWAEQRRERPLRQAEFDKALEQRGWQAKRIPHSGRAGWLIPDEPDSDTRYRGEAVKQGEAENDTFVTSRSIEQPLQSALTAPHPLTPEPDKLQPSGPVVDRNAFSRTRRQRREHQGTIPR